MNEDIKRALLQAHNEKHGRDDILKMRKVVQWAGSQDEGWWLTVDEGKRPTMAQIVRVYELVEQSEQDNIQDALDHYRWFQDEVDFEAGQRDLWALQDALNLITRRGER